MEHSATLHHYGCPMPKVNFRNRYFTKINIDTNEKGSLEFLDYSIKGGFLKELKIKDNVPEEKRHVLDNLYTEYMGSRGFGLLCLEDRHVVTAALFEKFFSYCYSTRSDNYRRLQGELGCSADEISGILEGYNLKIVNMGRTRRSTDTLNLTGRNFVDGREYDERSVEYCQWYI
ncbi:hypothetical protein QR680_011994 [Steinernema hermaphroditum]|uniref:Uncharacterized protein n=1 Tax=Steinernema hermaphroditum TaxID=289476 RepID=A0AA39LZ16_9BILA|nr:hypothetical protein QR680_011994 [Steinernema hermaphroditum]